jgi:hypothetical protein
MMGKWSSKPKGLETARVRENQRRHRGKIKAYIADLERRLSETQACLNDTLVQNSRLRSELEKLQAISARPCVVSDAEEATDDYTSTMASSERTRPQTSLPKPSSTSSDNEGQRSSLLPVPDLTHLSPRTLSPSGLEASQAAQPSRSPSMGSEVDTASSARKPPDHERSYARSPSDAFTPPLPDTFGTAFSQGDEDLAMLRSDCSHLLPPKPGESTIPCKTAYRIIKEQNYNGADLSAVEVFLAPGFRGATVQEDGCRVESTRVFSILDVINH